MTKEELMKPRYKVIADYPFASCKVGNIYIQTVSGSPKYYKINGGFLNNVDLEKYPHLFKKLEWWEERKIEDLPQYVKIDGRVWKLKNYEMYLGQLIFKNEVMRKNETENFASISWHFNKHESTPATEEEFNNSKSEAQ